MYDARALRVIVDDEGGSRTGDAWAAAYRWVRPSMQCSQEVSQRKDAHMIRLDWNERIIQGKKQNRQGRKWKAR